MNSSIISIGYLTTGWLPICAYLQQFTEKDLDSVIICMILSHVNQLWDNNHVS